MSVLIDYFDIPAPGFGLWSHRELVVFIMGQVARVHCKLQSEVASSQRHVGVMLGGADPDAGAGLAFVQILARDAEHERDLNHQQKNCSIAIHAATSAKLATRRRRMRSSAHPPARNNTPSTIRPRERSSLPMMSEK